MSPAHYAEGTGDNRKEGHDIPRETPLKKFYSMLPAAGVRRAITLNYNIGTSFPFFLRRILRFFYYICGGTFRGWETG